MCGRYGFSNRSVKVLASHLRIEYALDLEARINHAPTMMGPVAVGHHDGAPEIKRMRWGLSAPWTKAPLINAKSETVLTKRTFRDAVETRRCLVVADYFYEWQAGTKLKQPWEFRLAGGEPMIMAGIWQPGRVEGELVECYSILTTEANETLKRCHDRMPVILEADEWGHWLDPAADIEELQTLWVPWAGPMEARPVTTALNKVSYQGEEIEATPTNTDERPQVEQSELKL
ncbi:SOS response-associated peptidase [Prosthecobacter sp. SYSU 5D2]|uniref:SOS response-associated peptidase n=1 Tax=Prosthecobacter sp. SYSU 5D2 TaxID=3134134 RepID=UPI0031FE5060